MIQQHKWKNKRIFCLKQMGLILFGRDTMNSNELSGALPFDDHWMRVAIPEPRLIIRFKNHRVEK